MKIVFIVAAAPEDMCGVTDYAIRLAAAFQQSGTNAIVERLDMWSFKSLRLLRHKYRNDPDVIFHLQYPTIRLGRSIAPGFAPLILGNCFTTLHEFGLFNFLRKAAFLPSSLLSRKIIFSNIEEKGRFQRMFPHSGSRLAVVPIGSNIPQLTPRDLRAKPERLVYFGQISRNKGVEFFLDAVAALRDGSMPVEVEMIGAMVDSNPDFVQLVRNRAERDRINLSLNMPAERVSAALNDATIALLPFPDGISDKRGSALASLQHGVTVLTTHSDQTPAWLRQVTHAVISPHHAADLIHQIAEGGAQRRLAPETLTRELRMRSWSDIAHTHLTLYRAALSGTGAVHAALDGSPSA